jgi:hypothetical protein
MWHAMRADFRRGRACRLIRGSLPWGLLGCLATSAAWGQAPGTDSAEARVAAIVARLGGQIEREGNAPGGPVTAIRLATTRVSDEQVRELGQLASLRHLDLTQTRVTDDGLARLRGHQGLRSLVLYDTRLTDRGFEHLATIRQLESLSVGQCRLRGPGVSQLGAMQSLKSLSLVDLDATDETLAGVAQLRQLERLDLIELGITDASLGHLRELKRLRSLHLDGNPITDDGLAQLAGLTSLEELGLEGTQVSDAGLRHLKDLPKLRRLGHGDTKITDEGLRQLPRLDRPPAAGIVSRSGTDRPAKSEGEETPQPQAGVDAQQVREALERALVPLQRTLVVYAEKRDCFSCHNQAVPLVALVLARSRGLAIDEESFQAGVTLTLADLESANERYRQGRGQPGGAMRAAYALWTLEAAGHPPDETTAAVAAYLLRADQGKDHWTTSARRVPIEASHFTTTALALQGLQAYASAERHDVLKDRVRRARAWLATARPVDTEDRVFRLWGLKLAGASAEEITAATRELRATQRADGGWSQTDDLASDAYATGSALVALHRAGGLPTDDPAYRRGVASLLRSQRADGTWRVASRSVPFQLYFESGFPYGKDQFISAAASGWAAAALALAVPPGAGR